MPRAKANPDPMVEFMERPDMPGVVFELRARRDGGWEIHHPDGRVFTGRGSMLFGRYPSNKRQAEAMSAAKGALLGRVKELFE